MSEAVSLPDLPRDHGGAARGRRHGEVRTSAVAEADGADGECIYSAPMSVDAPRKLDDQVKRIGGLFAAACVVGLGAAHLVNAWVLNRDIPALDAGTDGSVLERIGTLAVAVSAAAVALLAARHGPVFSLGSLTLLLAFLCVDDVLEVHESVGDAWKLLYLPILGAVLALLWIASRSLPSIAPLIQIGLLLLVVSFVLGDLAERMVDRYGWSPRHVGYELKTVFKDGAEVGGWILIATGLTAAAVRTRREGRPSP
jgi:hypothetical protein